MEGAAFLLYGPAALSNHAAKDRLRTSAQKENTPNPTIQRVSCGAPPGTRTLGPLIKRNREAFFVQTGILRKSVISIQSPLFYIFIHIAFFASCARLCIQFPALRCAENVQKCAEGKSVPFHSVPAGVKTIGQMEQPPSACQSAAGGCSLPLSQVTYCCATRRPCQGSS